MSVSGKPPGWDYEKRGNMSKYIGMSMVGLHVKSIDDKIIDCYIDYEGLLIIHAKQELEDSILFSNKNYQSDYTTDEGHIILYKIPDKYQDDLIRFIEGKYSKFSKEFIGELYNYSGLQHNQILFYTIRKEQIWKDQLEEYYGCEIPGTAELLSKPTERNFKSFSDFFKDEIEDERQNS